MESKAATEAEKKLYHRRERDRSSALERLKTYVLKKLATLI